MVTDEIELPLEQLQNYGNYLIHLFNVLHLCYRLLLFTDGGIMHTLTRTPTTEMEVTSIRLERELKEKLKELSGNQGYQALIRDILWDYVEQRSRSHTSSITQAEIRATIAATAHQPEACALTGVTIAPDEPMLLGLTTTGSLIPLSLGSLEA